MAPETPIAELVGATKKTALAALAALGIRTVRDLLFHFPFRHEDFSTVVPVRDVREGDRVIDAEVRRLAARRVRRHMSVVEALLGDATDEIRAVWFNQPYVAKTLVVGSRCRFYGKVQDSGRGLQFMSPRFAAAAGSSAVIGLLPVYPLSGSLTQYVLRQLVQRAMPLADILVDPLPEKTRQRLGLLPLGRAIHEAHFPASFAMRAVAMRRLGFDELYALQLAVAQARAEREAETSPVIPFAEREVRSFVAALPFTLTGDQKRAAWDAVRDMEKPRPMHRLLNGDVGSGKTAVAAVIMMNAAAAGKQSALMVPTEVLAAQHFATLAAMFRGTDVSVALWTNSQKKIAEAGEVRSCEAKRDREPLREALANGDVSIVVGTHALIEPTMKFHDLAFAIIDEQHRFGVGARRAMLEKRSDGLHPHLLSMSATPIPRTLAIAAFGDLDISLLKEKPRHRKPIRTRVIGGDGRSKAYGFIASEIAAGRQVFVVCPLISPSDTLGAASVEEMDRRLKNGPLAAARIVTLHGKMRPAEKDRAMGDFKNGSADILVATSVIEVGVDVPNATVMCIEGAERFGLAQLHQFRGRVGRGAAASSCFLFPTDDGDVVSLKRLRLLERCGDGFTLAEHDLSLRGPGELLGETQTGFASLRIANIGDTELLAAAKSAAQEALAAGVTSAVAPKTPHFE